LVLLLGVTVAAAATGLWVLTAIPIGFLFGFFLQKGDLCGASAFSEVLVMRDGWKVLGLWAAIVVGMLGIAVLDLLGWVTLNPKPMVYLSYIVGGLIFGVGMVLAGGCVSGCLFKSGTGNLNSMAGLVGIPIGVALTEYGPLAGLNKYLNAFVIKTAEGKPITFSSVTGLPFWALAIVFGAVTLAAVLAFRTLLRRRQPRANTLVEPRSVSRWANRPWRPWQAGLMIGLLAIPAYLSSAASGRNYPLGVTHGVLFVESLAFDSNFKHVWKKPPAKPQQKADDANASRQAAGESKAAAVGRPNPKKPISWWLVALVTSLVAGSWFSGSLSGQSRLLPKPPDETVVAFIGGILVGIGAGLAKGCVIGNITSGIALMSVGVCIFAVCTVLANWVTTYLYLLGGGLRRTE
jgi:uncharacterized membrane protein YedE/YeeE